MAFLSCTGPRGQFSHVESGTGVLINGSTNFSIAVSDLIFTFKFESRSSEPAGYVADVSAVGKTLSLTFVNFNDTLGMSWQGEVGTLQNKPLWASIYTAMLGSEPSETRLVHYSFFVKEG